MDQLSHFLCKKTSVVTCDGRVLVGILEGIDQYVNLILKNCEERKFSKQGVSIYPLGLFIVRGENVVFVGEIDSIIDDDIDFKLVMADPLPPLKH